MCDQCRAGSSKTVTESPRRPEVTRVLAGGCTTDIWWLWSIVVHNLEPIWRLQKENLQLVAGFWVHFVAYQIETCRQLISVCFETLAPKMRAHQHSHDHSKPAPELAERAALFHAHVDVLAHRAAGQPLTPMQSSPPIMSHEPAHQQWRPRRLEMRHTIDGSPQSSPRQYPKPLYAYQDSPLLVSASNGQLNSSMDSSTMMIDPSFAHQPHLKHPHHHHHHQHSHRHHQSHLNRQQSILDDRFSLLSEPTEFGSESDLYSRSRSTGMATGQRLHYVHHGVNHQRWRQPEGAVTSTPATRTHQDNQSPAGQAKGKQQQAQAAGKLVKVSLAGAKRRLGFKQKGGLSSLSVQRSEEIVPDIQPELSWSSMMSHKAQLTSGCSLTSDWTFGDSFSSASTSIRTHSAPATCTSHPHANDSRVCFVDGLGAGQIVSRQALVAPYLGDVQLGLSSRRGMLEVEVIRVRQLQSKVGSKQLPSPYVKVYLMKDKKCIAKFKTTQMRHTLDPLFQERFIFRDQYEDCVLQIIVWADYSKRERKFLMGVAQIHLNDLDISDLVLGWYRLFNAASMASSSSLKISGSLWSSSKVLRQTLSSSKLCDSIILER